jgi:hypothetical protein
MTRVRVTSESPRFFLTQLSSGTTGKEYKYSSPVSEPLCHLAVWAPSESVCILIKHSTSTRSASWTLSFNLTSQPVVAYRYGDGMCCHSNPFSVSTLTDNHRDRPVNDAGERVTPSDLEAHRLSHRFLGPCCICAASEEQLIFTESAIVLVLSGRRAGQYVARCAQGKCGYYGV